MTDDDRAPGNAIYERPLGLLRGGLWLLVLFFLFASIARCGGSPVSWHAIVWPLLAIPLVINLGVMIPRLGLFARPILSVKRAAARDRIALTFDDGPHPTETRRILDLLDQHGQKATFFIVGKRAESARDLVEEIVRRGHALGNHSYHHAHSTPFANVAQLAEDLMRVNGLIRQVQGRATRWFRPPVGLISPRVRKAAEQAGLEIVAWTAKARDGWHSTTVPQATERLVAALRPGAILLLHDGTEKPEHHPIAAVVLADLLIAMKERGLRSVTLDELLDDSASSTTQSS